MDYSTIFKIYGAPELRTGSINTIIANNRGVDALHVYVHDVVLRPNLMFTTPYDHVVPCLDS